MDVSDIGHATGGTLSGVSNWAAQPFKSNMTALSWVLFLGLVICASWAWTRLLGHFE
jgi:hypothetical protein